MHYTSARGPVGVVVRASRLLLRLGTTPGQGVRTFVNAREGESFEELYRRFKRGLEASGILREYRRKQRFKPNHEVRRDKIRAAARKLRRARGRRSD